MSEYYLCRAVFMWEIAKQVWERSDLSYDQKAHLFAMYELKALQNWNQAIREGWQS